MSRRLSYEFIKEQFEKEGYELLIREYTDNKQKLMFICPNGHKHSINYASWTQGNRCFYCHGSAKKDIEFIRSEFEKEGYELLSSTYLDNKQKLEYICPNGHRSSVSWSMWSSRKSRCPYCYGKVRLTLEFVKTEFEKEGYKLLSEKYLNSRSKLNYICPKGHFYNITWGRWKLGNRCKRCALCGSNNPSWKGGISCEPYCDIWLDKEYKQSIKDRDGNECNNPQCFGHSKRIVVHHVDYNKKNCHPSNLITLCSSCNCRANTNRDYWRDLYTEIIRSRYYATV